MKGGLMSLSGRPTRNLIGATATEIHSLCSRVRIVVRQGADATSH